MHWGWRQVLFFTEIEAESEEEDDDDDEDDGKKVRGAPGQVSSLLLSFVTIHKHVICAIVINLMCVV